VFLITPSLPQTARFIVLVILRAVAAGNFVFGAGYHVSGA
jgi:hypothetical protein